ncbi:ABC transporter permease [uncultured Parabacteroides sp.]|jgi:ABC-type antimicrobial peptide transport system permease subunit|uniref:ABC transporter permease n=1 Tax=uncultured Parabacteroides sp. TaxID=512312 RepID=UPI0034247ADE
MFKQYLKQAWQLMKQNRFYSAIYIIGTGLAISMVMVMAIAYHIRTADMAPEVNRDRTLYLNRLQYTKGKSTSDFFFGTRVVRECLYTLTTAQAVATATDPTLSSLLLGDNYADLPGGGNPLKVSMMATNDGFWQVFRFRFLEGQGYDAADFTSGINKAVISVSTARKLFGETNVTGRPFLLNDTEYTVSGVVADVSGITPSVCADLWIPYTTFAAFDETGKGERDVSIGFLCAYILPRDGVTQKEMAGELDEALRRYNSTLRDGKIVLTAPLDSHGEHVVRQFIMNGVGTNVGSGGEVRFIYTALGLLVFLFLLIPALNLSGLNASHMHDRIPELGVRQAFGARKSGLFLQVLVENMLLMLPGGIMGLVFSYILVMLFRKLLLASGIISLLMGNTDMVLTPGMLINLPVFFYAFLVCLVLNILSSMIPVWRAVRVNITDALNS